jgi:hypothetical protein
MTPGCCLGIDGEHPSGKMSDLQKEGQDGRARARRSPRERDGREEEMGT